jgi:sigma-E factor negative regulatory protein RseC
MNMVEEAGVIVSLDGNYASVAPLSLTDCKSCAGSGGCGTTLLAPLFSKKKRLLVAENTINAKPGDEVVIGLNRTALVFASLMVYLVPLLVLVIAAVAGESLALGLGLEDGELIAILSGLGGASLTFIFVSRVIRSAFFSVFFEPILINRR